MGSDPWIRAAPQGGCLGSSLQLLCFGSTSVPLKRAGTNAEGHGLNCLEGLCSFLQGGRKSKQVMKPDHSARFSLPDIRIQMRFPKSPPSSVWPVILQPAGELPLLFSIHKTSISPCPQQPRAGNTHQTPPQERLHLGRDVETHTVMCQTPTVFVVHLALANPEIFLALQRGSSKRKAWQKTSESRES